MAKAMTQRRCAAPPTLALLEHIQAGMQELEESDREQQNYTR
jgi:hypothetical protein